MKSWHILFFAVVSEVIATSALKESDGFSNLIPSVIVVIGYALSFYLLSLTLAVIPISIAYAVWSGLGIVLLALIGWLVFGQALDWAAVIGMLFIITGILIMNTLSTSSVH